MKTLTTPSFPLTYAAAPSTYPTGARMSLAQIRDKQVPTQPFRASGHYGSTASLRSLATDSSGRSHEYTTGSLINLHDQRLEVSQMRRRSPSLPPIYNGREQRQYFSQNQQRDFGVEGAQYQYQKQQKEVPYHSHHRENHKDPPPRRYNSPSEECGGETSGYASDSVDGPLPVVASQGSLPDRKSAEREMTERTWQNPYYTTPDSSLPPSRRKLSAGRMGELNRPRWGSVWGQNNTAGAGADPPPPSWLARLAQSSQVLVINHDSASSPDSSTTGSTGSDTNKTYLRGQNIRVDADVLQERELRRQKALELQSAIKQQLEEKDRERRAETERREREERLEEERIKRHRDKEKERFEEEQKRLREKEDADTKKAQAMRQVLEAAERLAKEEKMRVRRRRKRENSEPEIMRSDGPCGEERRDPRSESPAAASNSVRTREERINGECEVPPEGRKESIDRSPSKLEKDESSSCSVKVRDESSGRDASQESSQAQQNSMSSLHLPIGKDVAIVLSGRLEDPEILGKAAANLQVVNLVVSPRHPRHARLEVPCSGGGNVVSSFTLGFNALLNNTDCGPIVLRGSPRSSSPRLVENRLLTPSKYRLPAGRDFGTQTDVENDLEETRERIEELSAKEVANGTAKDRKETTNASRRDVEKATDHPIAEEFSMKSRSKSQPRASLDSRPRWNANRPGTRYRTQSEKDPHYQRRMRLRRRRVESSDERSRSPSPDRRKNANAKTKARNSSRRKPKMDSYDGDLSMDSLNSIVPLRVDKNGRINIESYRDERNNRRQSCCDDRINEADRIKLPECSSDNIWRGHDILSKLSSLKNGLLMKQLEWDPERCLLSPVASEIF